MHLQIQLGRVAWLADVWRIATSRRNRRINLIADLHSGPGARNRIVAVRLLPEQKADAAKIVPVMIKCLKDQAGDIRLSAADRALGQFGEEAKSAIPGLRGGRKGS